VLGCSLLAGLGHLVYVTAVDPSRFGLNYDVYRGTAARVVAGDPLYAGSPVGDPELVYLYPPVVAVAFVPMLVVGPAVGYAAFTAASLAVAAGLGLVLCRLAAPAGDRLPTVDRWLVVAFAVASVYPMPSHVFGNVNVPMAAAFGASVLAATHAGTDGTDGSDAPGTETAGGVASNSVFTAVVEGRREAAAGGWLAVAAAPKLFPAAFGVWLLARRAWRAAAAAVGGGVGLAAVSVATFGVDAHVAYVTEALVPRREAGVFAGGLSPAAEYVTLQRPLSHLLPRLAPDVYPLVAATLVAPIVWLTSRRAASTNAQTDWLVALYATVAGVLVVLPSYPTYYVLLTVPLVPVCYRLDAGLARRLFLAGAVVAPVTLRPAQVATVLAPAPAPISRTVMGVVEPALTVSSVRLVGVLATLVACALYALDRPARSGRR
jgi:hypothetical protein